MDDTLTVGSGHYYCLGFHNEKTNDMMTCAGTNSKYASYTFSNHYTVSDTYFDLANTNGIKFDAEHYYGLTENAFFYSDFGAEPD